MPRLGAGGGGRFHNVTLGSVSPSAMAKHGLGIIENFNDSLSKGQKESNKNADSSSRGFEFLDWFIQGRHPRQGQKKRRDTFPDVVCGLMGPWGRVNPQGGGEGLGSSLEYKGQLWPGGALGLFYFILFFVFLPFLGLLPRHMEARGRIGAVAPDLQHSHSN